MPLSLDELTELIRYHLVVSAPSTRPPVRACLPWSTHHFNVDDRHRRMVGLRPLHCSVHGACSRKVAATGHTTEASSVRHVSPMTRTVTADRRTDPQVLIVVMGAARPNVAVSRFTVCHRPSPPGAEPRVHQMSMPIRSSRGGIAVSARSTGASCEERR